MGNRCLEGIQTIIEREQCVPAEGDDKGFLVSREDR